MACLVPAQYGKAEFVEKRSRFIGQIWPVKSEDEARRLIAETRSRHHDARHNCWCFILRGGIERYSDDGEPQGTAGQPMLEVLRRSGVENALCIVTRYFGGVLLGAGGLARAYARAAKMALSAAGTARELLWACLEITCPYGLFERARREVEALGGVVEDVSYGAEVAVRACLAPENAPRLAERLLDISAGAVRCAAAGEKYVAVRQN